MTAKICIGIPAFGPVAGMTFELAGALFGLSDAFDALVGAEHWSHGKVTFEPASAPSDLVDGRADLFARFLERTDYTHLLCVDADTAGTPEQFAKVIRGMLRADVGWIGCPIPLKEYDWRSGVRAALSALGLILPSKLTGMDDAMRDAFIDDISEQVRAAAMRYSPDLTVPPIARISDDVLEVERVGLAFTLLRRATVQRLVNGYPELRYWPPGPKTGPGKVAVPLLWVEPSTGELVREDYAVALRAKELGERLYLYVGDGAPLGHVGQHCWRGSPLSVGRPAGST
jgi:hypothetical protein